MKRVLFLALLLIATTAHATVNTTSQRVQYSCDGATVNYAYAFTIWEDDDLVVTQADANLVETTLVLNTDYTVTGAGGTGGNVVLADGSSCTSNDTLTVIRNIELTQDIDLVDGEAFSAETLEDGYDNQMLVVQDQKEKLDRVFSVPKSSSLTGVEVNPAADQALCWNSSGNGLTNCPTSGITTNPKALIGDYDSLADAVTAIGATPATLIIDRITILADGSTVAIPSTLTLEPVGAGKIDGTAGGSVETLILNQIIKGDGVFYGYNLTVDNDAAEVKAVHYGINSAQTSTVNETVMQSILDSAPYNQTILLPSGSIPWGSVTANRGVRIKGTGSLVQHTMPPTVDYTGTRLACDDPTNPAIHFYSKTNDLPESGDRRYGRFVLEDIYLDGDGDTAKIGVQVGEDTANDSDATFTQFFDLINVTAQYFSSEGIKIYNSGYGTISRCRSAYNGAVSGALPGYGLYMADSGSTTIWVSESSFIANEQGMKIEGGSRIDINNITIEQSEGLGFESGANFIYSNLTNVYFEGNNDSGHAATYTDFDISGTFLGLDFHPDGNGTDDVGSFNCDSSSITVRNPTVGREVSVTGDDNKINYMSSYTALSDLNTYTSVGNVINYAISKDETGVGGIGVVSGSAPQSGVVFERSEGYQSVVAIQYSWTGISGNLTDQVPDQASGLAFPDQAGYILGGKVTFDSSAVSVGAKTIKFYATDTAGAAGNAFLDIPGTGDQLQFYWTSTAADLAVDLNGSMASVYGASFLHQDRFKILFSNFGRILIPKFSGDLGAGTANINMILYVAIEG